MTFSNRFEKKSVFLVGKPPNLKRRRILITGINGFLGCHVASFAVKGGAEVAGIDLEQTTWRGEKIRRSLGIGPIKIYEVADLTIHELNSILAEFNPEMIIHLAGSVKRESTPEAWMENIKVHVLLTASVISAISAKSEKFRPVLVTTGSQLEYGLAPMPWKEERNGIPYNSYGAGKAAATELVLSAIRSKALTGCVVRFPLVFGPGQSPVMIVPELICKALKDISFNMTKGRQQRRFVYASDAANFLLTIANLLHNGDKIPSLINASACEPISLIEMVKTLMTYLPRSVDLRVGALAERTGERMKAWPDSSLADTMKLITVTPMEKGLELTADWYIQNRWFVDLMSDYC